MSIYETNKDNYPYVVEFEKCFTKGNLNGLTIKDRLHFTSKKDANSWIEAVSKLNRDGQYFNFTVKEVA